MWLRVLLLTCVVGCLDVGNVSDGQPGSISQDVGGVTCINKFGIQALSCVMNISVLPIEITVALPRFLNSNELSILSDDLNAVAIRDANVTDPNKILSDVEAVILDDLRNKFGIPIDRDDIDVCTNVLGTQLCR